MTGSSSDSVDELAELLLSELLLLPEVLELLVALLLLDSDELSLELELTMPFLAASAFSMALTFARAAFASLGTWVMPSASASTAV